MGFVNIGPLELLVIGIIALLVLGPKRLPEAARSLGKGFREMRQALQGDQDDEVYVPDPPETPAPKG
ncbi:MAG: twin-arginine translocase TatA/TatE family subunit [Thermoleophilaceae bacterium]